MSQSTTQLLTLPWKVDVLTDMFGYYLLVEGRRFYIPREQLDSVIVALSLVKERQAVGHDWLIDLGEAIRGERGERDEPASARE